MSSDPTAGPGATPGREPTEDEVRAMIEEQMKNVTPDDLIVRCIVDLVNLGARRLGLVPGTEGERDLEHAGQCIDAASSLFTQIESRMGEQLADVKQAISQLQMAYAQAAHESGAGSEPAQGEGDQAPPASTEPPARPGPGQAQSSGRLWVPGQ